MKQDLGRFLLIFGLHLVVIFSIYIIFSFLGFVQGYPTNGGLHQWDVGWYESIKDSGYSFQPGEQSNVAFFPLFPLLWRLFPLSHLGISLINLLLFAGGVFLLYRTYHLDAQKTLLIFSIPSVFFCYVPYSEALFFLAGSLILYGLRKNNWIAVLGVVMACLARSASLLFIPILLFAKLYQFRPGRDHKRLWRETLMLILSALISTLLAQYIQYLDTGVFFTLFQAQESWDRFLKYPTLYFTTIGESRLIWLDGLGLLVGVTSAVAALILIAKKFGNIQKRIAADYLFSIGYLALVALVTVLYSGLGAHGGTTLHSLNRFVFATPFFMVFLIVLLKRNWLNTRHIILFGVISTLTWFLFGGFGHLPDLDHFALPYFKTKIYFLIASLYAFLFLMLSNKQYSNHIWSGLYLLNVILQIYLFHAFMHGTWIG
jgi:hypothetical protein